MSLSDEQRNSFEHRWTNHLAKQHLSRPDRCLWHAYAHTKRTFALKGKVYVIWRAGEDDVEVLDLISLADVGMSLAHGVELKFTSRLNGQVVITSIPSRIPGTEVFAWVPPFADLRYAPADWNVIDDTRVLQVSLSFKERTALDHEFEIGEQYVSALRDFKRQHPNAVI